MCCTLSRGTLTYEYVRVLVSVCEYRCESFSHTLCAALYSQNYSHSQRGNKLRFMCERFVQKVAQPQPIVNVYAGVCLCVCESVLVCVAWSPLWYGEYGKWQMAFCTAGAEACGAKLANLSSLQH